MSGRRSIGPARSRRFVAAWLGLHALLLQLLLPVIHHPEHVFASGGALAAALVALADAGPAPAAHHPSDGKPVPSCPLCLSIQHAQPVLPPTAPAFLLPTVAAAAMAVAPPADAARWTNSAARARAPPLA